MAMWSHSMPDLLRRAVLLAGLVVVAGCLPPRPPPVDTTPPPLPASPVVAVPAAVLPPLDREPLLEVALVSGPKVTCRLLVPATHPVLGRLEGLVEATADRDGLRINGRPVPGEAVVLTPVAQAAVVFTQSAGRRHAGAPVFRRHGAGVVLGERVALETLLGGVLGAEMSPSWPSAALEAQAVVARTFAADRWLRRQGEPWHLTAAAASDMAYTGLPATPQPRVAAAVAATRGELLIWEGLPVPTFFHAASGGRTTAATVWDAGIALADGQRAAPALPGVPDEASIRGAAGLNLSDTHHAWTARITAAQILAAAARVRGGDRIPGTLRGIEVEVDTVEERALAITLLLDGDRRVSVPAARFRVELGGQVLRSTWITRTSYRDGVWSVRGLGYGHGVGLSQVGAWQLAKDGWDSSRILRHYFPRAAAERRW
jgi:SpoIID/LytB domain protein